MIDFNDANIVNKHNIQPTTNPKPLTVQRIRSEIRKDGNVVGYEDLLIQNVAVYPDELI